MCVAYAVVEVSVSIIVCACVCPLSIVFQQFFPFTYENNRLVNSEMFLLLFFLSGHRKKSANKKDLVFIHTAYLVMEYIEDEEETVLVG